VGCGRSRRATLPWRGGSRSDTASRVDIEARGDAL
jgi:hypothetical protein